ncbi:MAG: hypothetical protein O3B73_14715 [bacterium]|jgi:hypothetical protein|nr:hypothetical protein [bacterium]
MSGSFELTDMDAAPDLLFNEIIWKAVKGPHSEMPTPVRRARLVPLSSIAFTMPSAPGSVGDVDTR